jgi:hypothetical protein
MNSYPARPAQHDDDERDSPGCKKDGGALGERVAIGQLDFLLNSRIEQTGCPYSGRPWRFGKWKTEIVADPSQREMSPKWTDCLILSHL